MSIGSKRRQLGRLESRLHVERCPHCSLAVPRRDAEDREAFTFEEQYVLLQKIFVEFYDRASMLELLATLKPR